MIKSIEKRLREHVPKNVHCADSIRAGVIVPIFEQKEDFCFLLTKRSDSVRYHKGEVSFPGGMYEAHDGNIMNTALRELGEEVGVNRDDVELIGRLDDVYTLTGFVITPYVGRIPYPYEFRMSPQEVAYIVTLPYSFLKSVTPELEATVYDGKSQTVQAFNYNGDRIWGATCRMLMQFRFIMENGYD